MKFFVVTMSHPDGPEWGQHVMPHVEYLSGLIEAGKLRASGPVVGGELRAGLLLFTVEDRAELDALLLGEPFSGLDAEFAGEIDDAEEQIAELIFHVRFVA